MKQANEAGKLYSVYVSSVTPRYVETEDHIFSFGFELMVSIQGIREGQKFVPRHEARCTNPCTAVQVDKWWKCCFSILV